MISPPAALRFDRGGSSEERWALLFDGRLDNRDELARELGLGDAADAEIVLRFLSAGRWDALDRFLGPWALALFDLQAREAHLARDPTGERMLCWHADPRRVVVASEPAALLDGPDVPGDADEATLAAFFAMREPDPGATFFRAVRQVPAGYRIVISAAGERRHRFWNPDLSLLPPAEAGEADTVERFRELIGLAVRAQLRGPGPAAVLLSGGLDSTTVAAHAARVSRGAPAPIRAVSWRFHELTGADESAYAQAMMTAAGLDPVWVEGDGCWPLRDLDQVEPDPNGPFENPYRELHAAAFAAAAGEGARLLLTGHFSDEMYHGVDAWWLRDCLARGDWAAAAEGLRDEVRWRSRPDVWTPGLRRTLGVLLLGTGWERLRSLRTPDWLTPYGRERLRSLPSPPQLRARHPEQAETLLAPFALMGIAAEMRRAREHGVELRFPFRDRRLIEFALRVPADRLARPGWRKRLVWLAGEGWLPDEVRLRRQRSNLGSLFVRGLEREHGAVRDLLFGPGPQLWRRWVEAGPIERFLDASKISDTSDDSGLPAQVFWHCLTAEMWARGRL